MTYEKLKSEIEKKARFQSLVHLPEKFEVRWVARATVDDHGINGEGQTDLEALQNLLTKLT